MNRSHNNCFSSDLLFIVFLAILMLAGCNHPIDKPKTESAVIAEVPVIEETVPNVVIEETDSLTVYYPNFSRVDFVMGEMPDKQTDTNVIFCCAAAFTGECLTEFKHTNIAGDHVSSGVRYRGYPCKRNTGAFVWYDGRWKFLWEQYSNELDSAALHGGMGFGQEMIIHEGSLCVTIRKDKNENQFRALCEANGKLCVIDSKSSLRFGDYKRLLLNYGVTEALYIDMGEGWSHSWYRDANNLAIDLFPKTHDYCTNWVTFYKCSE